MNVSLTTLIPQNDDSVAMLLARIRGTPLRATALASAARTISTSSADIETLGFRGIGIWINCSVASGTGGLTTYVQTQDPVSGIWTLSYVASAPITTVRTTSILLGPGVSIGSNIGLPTGQSDRGIMLPSKIRLYVVHADATSYTYSVGYELIP